MPEFEQKVKWIAESQELAPDDKLTRLLEGSAEDELSVDDLDFVSAAGGSDYQRFLARLKGRG